VRPVHAHRIEHRDGIIGHIGQRVVHPVELRREPDVAVVEPDDPEAFGTEEEAPLLRIVDALRPQPVDQQQRRCARITERLVVDLDLTVPRRAHVPSLGRRS